MNSTVTVKKQPLTTPVPVLKVGQRVQARTGNMTGTVEAVRLAGPEIVAQIRWANDKVGTVPEKMLKGIETVEVVPPATATGKVVAVKPQAPRQDPKTLGLERQLGAAEKRVQALEHELSGLKRAGAASQQLAELQYLKKQLGTQKSDMMALTAKNINFQLALEALGLSAAAVEKVAAGQGLVTEDLPKNQTPDLSVLVQK